MSLRDRITRHPLPFDPDKGVALRALYEDTGAGALIEGTGGASPFLATLLEGEAAWLRPALARPPEDVLADLLSGLAATTPADLGPTLRQAKRRIALLTALCDLGGVWTLEEVTGALSDFADAALQLAISTLVQAAQAAGQLPRVEAPDGGLFVLAMGKLGARELNYSSDIDLIVLFDEDLYAADDYPSVRKQFIRITQALVKAFGPGPDGGYVLRTDLRLRPDPSVTPVCIGMGAAERYYEAQGRTWERAAFIRARVAAGDRGAGARFLEDLRPFIWRRHLDFAAIQDAHDMRLRIRDHKRLGGPFSLPGHNVKLGSGGIREIEFFVQTKQLICGGRDPSLRSSQTRPALAALAAAGWIPEAAAAELSEAYVAHRTLEHRLQMVEDAQTHSYPVADRARARLAALCGAADGAAFEAREAARFERVNTLVESFFAPKAAPEAPRDPWAALPDPEATRRTVDAWQSLPALRSDRARWLFERLAPAIAARLQGAADPTQALSRFDGFLRRLPAGVQVFALFEANPQILDLLVDICATAPRLAEYLGQHPAAFDAVLGRDFFEPLPGAAALRVDLAARLDRAGDYERKLDAARIWVREQSFRMGVQILRKTAAPAEAGAGYAAIAQATLQGLFGPVVDEVARRHGPPPGQGAAVLAMGKLGSAEMTARSDLDLIVVYDAPLDAMSDGPRPLATTAWYARFTQTLVAALSVQTARGGLYEVDMRLRPSGQQGPVATSLAAFSRYQRDEAWTWERLALTRGRVVAGAPGVAAALDAAVTGALAQPRPARDVLRDVREMRDRLAAAKTSVDPWDMKTGAGHMLDIELLLQTGRVLTPAVTSVSPLGMIPGLVAAGWLERSEGHLLADTLGRLTAVQQITRLAVDGRYEPQGAGSGLAALLAQVTGQRDIATLARSVATETDLAAQIIDRRLAADA